MRFQEKVCFVTGAGSGIGRATALRFAREGGKIAVVDLKPEGGTQTVKQIVDSGREAMFAQADVSDEQQVRRAVDATISRWGRIDVLVNDAAMMTFKPVLELDVSDFDRVLAVNLRSVFLFCKYAGVRRSEVRQRDDARGRRGAVGRAVAQP